MADLLPVPLATSSLPAHSSAVVQEATAAFAHAGLHGTANTQRAYLSDLKQLKAWLEQEFPEQPLVPMTPAVLAQYASHMALLGRKLSTINRHIAAVNKAHELAGHTPPKDELLRVVLKGITRSISKQQREAKAFGVAELKKTVAQIDTDSLQGLRDRALLLIGFGGAFRRSELVALNLEHFEMRDGALIVKLLRSKTNQDGNLEEKALFYSPSPLTCPIRAFEAWSERLGRTEGPLFVRLVGASKHSQARLSLHRLTGHAVNKIVRHYLDHTPASEKFDASGKKVRDMRPRVTAHSLRASFVTAAVQSGQTTKSIQNQTKHKSTAMVDKYHRANDIVKDNAAQGIGL
jgi:site-specific recombinase XerD